LRYLFDDCVLDTDRRELHRRAEVVSVAPQVFDLLAYLISNRGRVVSKDDVIAAIWEGRIVSDAALTTRLNVARSAIGDSGEAQRLIKTLPRKGFRFVGAVREERGTVSGVPVDLTRPTLALPYKPSIAVLPFASISSDPEQEHFVDGLTEDLITDLSRNAGLFVIARNSTFAYKGKAVDARQIASDLGVRYLLEGSARRAAGRVRINVQLIDAAGGGHLWAERFDRNLEDVFALQDEVTVMIVEALVGRLTTPPPRNRPKSMEAYDLCVRARGLIDQSTQTAREAFLLLQRAIVLDPQYAEAHRWLALCLSDAWTLWGEPMEPNRRMSIEMAERAVALDPNDAGSHCVLGHVLAYEQRWLESDAEFAAALKLDPNHADAWAMMSECAVLSGKPVEGMEQIRKAQRLNPHPPGWYHWMLGQAQYAARHYRDAIETLRRVETYGTESRRFLAASLAQLGLVDNARREAELFMVTNPHFTISNWAATHSFRDEAMRQHFVDGYRKAGLPE
jgi:TolB-like protein